MKCRAEKGSAVRGVLFFIFFSTIYNNKATEFLLDEKTRCVSIRVLANNMFMDFLGSEIVCTLN